ncbi:MAG: hypothetical protein DDT39_01705 [Firmicutes bacterium]|nr:hypothetical protein [candidate division NPL-UPA2 bacterium]
MIQIIAAQKNENTIVKRNPLPGLLARQPRNQATKPLLDSEERPPQRRVDIFPQIAHLRGATHRPTDLFGVIKISHIKRIDRQ